MYLNSMYSDNYTTQREIPQKELEVEFVPSPNINKITKRNMLSNNLLKTYNLADYRRTSIVINTYNRKGLVIDPLLKGRE